MASASLGGRCKFESMKLADCDVAHDAPKAKMELDMMPVSLPKAAVPIVLPVPPGGVKVPWLDFFWPARVVRCWLHAMFAELCQLFLRPCRSCLVGQMKTRRNCLNDL